MSATTTAAAPPLMTAEEFVRLHGDESGVELVRGRIVRLPMPGGEHGEVCVTTGAVLRNYVKPNRLGRVLGNDTFVRVTRDPDTYRGPDVLFISYSRLPKDQPTPRGPIEVPPELVVEVRSPSDRPGEIDEKVEEYLAVGVSVVVVLDPGIDAATVYRPGGELPQTFSNGDELKLPDVLPGFAVPVREFFE